MSKLKIFSEKINISKKRVLVSLDLNVPISNFKIIDDVRIKKNLPFLKKLIETNAKVILVSHLGRPKGKIKSELSLKPVFEYLKKNLSEKIVFYDKNIDDNAVSCSKNLKTGEILFLENIRFFKEEEEDNEVFAKKLSNLADIFINEAFSCSHRKQASIHSITRFVESYGGPQLEKEIKSIDLIKRKKKKPVTCIIGGSKISTKINVLSSLIQNSDNLIVVGAMANNFLLFKGLKIGMSLIEKDVGNFIEKINYLAKKYSCKVFIPTDFQVSTSMNGKPIYRSKNDIRKTEIILDIGKNSLDSICKIIDSSNTVFWNGPAGFFENKNFIHGTISIAKSIAKNTKKRSLISIVGGGDTLAALNGSGFENSFTHLSTAGGAFLESLEGKELPAIKVLRK